MKKAVPPTKELFLFGFIWVFMAAVSLGVYAANTNSASPVGVWKTVDDKTNKAKSHIQIWEHKGKLYGKIVKLIDTLKENPVCDKCPGKLHNKSILGMTIMRGLEKDGDEWNGGTILDPESGKRYKVLIELKDGGKKLKVRGYMGVALLGRTQYWYRVK